MKIAILGSRGIPNNYGGFEQFAEYLSLGLVKKGHQVTVYNPHFHPYKKDEFQGVKIKNIYSPEKYLGGGANFLYDFFCLADAYRQDFEIIYELGYGSSAPSYFLLRLFKGRSVLITNMDGLEWKREKWNFFIKWLTKKFEKLAISFSDYLISDNIGIQTYYKNVYHKNSTFIPYGAELAEHFNNTVTDQYQLINKGYFLLIARLEPENNVEMIIQGYLLSKLTTPLVIIGNYGNAYGQYLYVTYGSPSVRFLGGIYDKSAIDSIRYFSKLYLHGHSVGGTNPSLLEAMACQCMIAAHDNEFNRSVLESNAYFFSSKQELTNIFENVDSLNQKDNAKVQMNLRRIKEVYNWDKIITEHELFFQSCLAEKNVSKNN